jgi:hypothetical protein
MGETEQSKSKPKSGIEWLIRAICFALGMCFMIFLLILPGIIMPAGQVAVPSPPLTGVFYGQVIDALSLNPIPNATVYICDSASLTSLLATVTTNVTGFYSTPNMTLYPNSFRISARAEGYYMQPLEWHDERAEYAGNATYYITPTKLYRISHNVGIWVLLPPDSHHGNPFVVSDNSNVTLELGNQAHLNFEVWIHNREEMTAAGTRYYGNHLSMYVAPSEDVSYPQGNMNVPSLFFAPDYSYGATLHQSYGLYFMSTNTSTTYRVTIVFQEVPYPEIYNTRIHILKSLSFYVQVGGS